MEKVISDTFITNPNFRNQQPSENQQQFIINYQFRKSPQCMLSKIITTIKTFNDKEILIQAIKNIGVTKHFINIDYIQTRSPSQINKIYTIISSLKKQFHKIKNIPTPQQSKKHISNLQLKVTPVNTARPRQQQSKQKSFQFLKKQIDPQTKIKQVILKQLQNRQKIQTKLQKIEMANKLKSQILQKRKETAKTMNKKAHQHYQKQKQIQCQQFQKIFQTTLQTNFKDHLSETFIKDFPSIRNKIQTQKNHQIVKKRLQNSKIEFQNYLQQRNISRLQKEKSLNEFKHRRLNSLNDRILIHKAKSQKVLQRKTATAEEEQNRKLNNFLQKQIKFIQNKKTSLNKENKSSEFIENHTINTHSLFRTHETRSVDLQIQNQKQKSIFEKINRKCQLKKIRLDEKVQKIRQKNIVREEKRGAFKESQIKFITEIDNNDTFIYHNNFLLMTDSYKNKSQQKDFQSENIKKKHQKLLKGLECEENILKLRKLPKSALIKYFQQIKQNTQGNKQQVTR